MKSKDIFENIQRIPTLLALDLEYSEKNMIDFNQHNIARLKLLELDMADFCKRIANKSKETLLFYNRMGIHSL